jgi:hypothetical protein
MEIVDDFTIVSFISKILTVSVKFLSFSNQSFFEFFSDWLMNIYMINSNTSLPTIKILSEENSNDCAVDFGCFINDNWAFASKFKNTGSKILSCLHSNKSSCSCWTCKANQIKWQLCDSLGNFDLTLNASIKS